MNKPKHTKGPWTIYKSKVEGTWIDPIGIRVDAAGTPETREANAKLIAAAPEMLEALEHCIAFFQVKGLIDDRACSPWNDALEAIRKAKGDS